MPGADRTWRRTSPPRPCASRARPEPALHTCTWSSCRHLLRDRHGLRRRCVRMTTERAEVAVRLGAVAPRHRDVELGIAPHAVLVHVEALRLDLRLDPDAPDLVQRPEAAVRTREDERADGDQAQALHAELLEAAAVDEALVPRREVAG